MNAVRIKYFTGRKKQSGATLIIIIISLIVLTVIGVAIYSLTSTATRSQVVAQGAAKAFYIAESGIRIASSEFRVVAQTDTVARDNKLINLQGLVIPMPNNQGQFSLDLSPDWVWAKTTVPASTSMTLYFPGKARSGLTFPSVGILKRKGYSTIAFFNSAPVIGSFSAPNGTPITFTFAPAYPYTFNAGDEGYIGYTYNSPQTVNDGGNLVLDNTGGKAAIFPPENGTIYIHHIATYPAPPNGSGQQYQVMSQYTYDVRIPYVIDPASPPATVTLQNLKDVSICTPGPSVPCPAFPLIIVYNNANQTDIFQTSRIYLGKTLAIQSTSTYGN